MIGLLLRKLFIPINTAVNINRMSEAYFMQVYKCRHFKMDFYASIHNAMQVPVAFSALLQVTVKTALYWSADQLLSWWCNSLKKVLLRRLDLIEHFCSLIPQKGNFVASKRFVAMHVEFVTIKECIWNVLVMHSYLHLARVCSWSNSKPKIWLVYLNMAVPTTK